MQDRRRQEALKVLHASLVDLVAIMNLPSATRTYSPRPASNSIRRCSPFSLASIDSGPLGWCSWPNAPAATIRR